MRIEPWFLLKLIPNMELTGLSLPLNYLLCLHRDWTDSTLNYISKQPGKKIRAIAHN